MLRYMTRKRIKKKINLLLINFKFYILVKYKFTLGNTYIIAQIEENMYVVLYILFSAYAIVVIFIFTVRVIICSYAYSLFIFIFNRLGMAMRFNYKFG